MIYELTRGNQPLLAVAIHNGHALRQEVDRNMALDEESRLREEDPYTGMMTTIAENRIVVNRSRFELDLNRPRENAVYLLPENAWGLNVWKRPLPDEVIKRSLKAYDGFYSHVHKICTHMKNTFKRFVVLDLHSYNHRRQGPDADPDEPGENPEVNIGTGTMHRERWTDLVNRFIRDLQSFDYLGRSLDVRENVKFKGGQLVRYIHEVFPNSGCALAVEFKKFFMEEWTGTVDRLQLEALREALRSTIPGLIEELNRIGTQD